jgi:hypothetical protein
VDEITVDWAVVAAIATAVTTLLLALATFWLAWSARRGIIENKQLIAATNRQADLLWENAIPHLVPVGLDVSYALLLVAYATGTIPARSVKAWVGMDGEVWIGAADLLTATGSNKNLNLAPSRAGSEPPPDWDDWLRRKPEGVVTHRVVMQWTGPGDYVTERAWWLSDELWQEVPQSLRG